MAAEALPATAIVNVDEGVSPLMSELHEIKQNIISLSLDMKTLQQSMVCQIEQSQKDFLAKLMNIGGESSQANAGIKKLIKLGRESGVASEELEMAPPPERTLVSASVHGTAESANVDMKAGARQRVSEVFSRSKSSMWIERAVAMDKCIAMDMGGVFGCLVSATDQAYLRWENFRERLLQYEDQFTERVLYKAVHSQVFSILSVLVIFINTAFLGYNTDRSVKKAYAGEYDSDATNNVEMFFTVFFVVELVLQIASDRLHFFLGVDCMWNFLDVFLVLTAVLEVFLSGIMPNMAFGRIFRLLRLVRLVRVVRAFKLLIALRTMAYCIISSFAALFWALVLVVLFQYIVAMIILLGVLGHLDSADGLTAEVQTLHDAYGSLAKCLCRLFEGISGGEDWAALAEPLEQVGAIYYFVWAFYIFAMLFGVLNVVTGLVVDSALEQGKAGRHELMRHNRKKRRKVMLDLRKIFLGADDDHDGLLTWEEFESYLQSEDVRSMLEVLGVELDNIAEVFYMLDVDGSDSVGINEFVGGLMGAKGTARSLDVCAIRTQLSHIHKLTNALSNECIPEIIGAINARAGGFWPEREDHGEDIGKIRR